MEEAGTTMRGQTSTGGGRQFAGYGGPTLSRRDFGKAAGAFTLVALASAACGGDGGGGGGSNGGGGDGVMLIWASRDYYVPPDQFKSFESDHPDVNLKWDVQADDNILQQLLRMRQAGQTMPDVIQDDTFLMEQYYKAGLLKPIDDQMARWKKEDPDLYNEILPIAWEDTEFDGKHYGLSVTANYDLLYFNLPWAKEAGVEPPFESFDDMYAALTKMKKARPDKVPMTVQAKPDEGVTMLKSMFAAVGTPYEGSKPDLHDPASLYVIDFFNRARKDGLIPPQAVAWGESETRAVFIRQDAGLIFDGITTAGDFNKVKNFKFGKQWDTTPLPTETGQGQSGKTVSAPRTWALTVDADDAYQSSLILRYISETDNLIEPLKNGSVPMRQTEALNDPRMTEILPFFNEDLKKAYLESQSLPAGQHTGEIEEVLVQMWDEIVKGTDSTAEQLADKYQPQLEEVVSS